MIKQASFLILLLIGPVLALATKGFAVVLALSGLTALVALSLHRPVWVANWRDNWRDNWRSLPVLPMAALGYILASAFWGISERAFDTTTRLILVVGFSGALIALFNTLPDDAKTRWARALRWSVGLGIFVALAIGPYNVYWPDARETARDYFELLRQVNNSLTVLPAFLFIFLGSWQGARKWLQAAIIAAACLITLLSQSQTSLLAMLLAVTAFGLATISTRLCRHLIFASLAVCTLAAPFIFSTAYQEKWVANYAPDIVVERGAGEIREWIYYVYAEEAVKKPVFGHGINGTKNFVPADLGAYVALSGDDPVLQDSIVSATQSGAAAAHAHNLFLQLIFEFGYLGTVLILAAIWRFFARLDRHAGAQNAPYYWASIAACLATVLFGLTLWHSWFMTAMGCLVIFARMSAELGLRAR